MKKFREDMCPYYSVYIQKCSLDFQAVCGGRRNTKEGYKSCVTYKLQRKEEDKEGEIK